MSSFVMTPNSIATPMLLIFADIVLDSSELSPVSKIFTTAIMLLDWVSSNLPLVGGCSTPMDFKTRIEEDAYALDVVSTIEVGVVVSLVLVVLAGVVLTDAREGASLGWEPPFTIGCLFLFFFFFKDNSS